MMALLMPEALTYDELRLWETIKATRDFWFLSNVDGSPMHSEHSVMLDVVSYNWLDLLDHVDANRDRPIVIRSEEHTSELQSLMRISYAVFCLKKKKKTT